eukprot:CAMPEP_0179142660 /NCGR_PEP_ID=MMETSP0796-20121207/68535_1 /TAXON_ID=73915 /ORGANISM="Pyrodinium bahamense, Strain pbaha01" /LENGTH=141 /DNA_ID=CAMNT_0020842559 /DNA_START=35 /DNA_END=460 /DNA_ORIENTATION=-
MVSVLPQALEARMKQLEERMAALERENAELRMLLNLEPTAKQIKEMKKKMPELVYNPKIIDDGVVKAIPWHDRNAAKGVEVTYHGRGYNGECLTVTAKNKMPEAVLFTIPKGAVLQPHNRSQQNHRTGPNPRVDRTGLHYH